MKLLTLTLVLLCGCARYHHLFVHPDGTREETSLGAFMYKGDASKVKSNTRMTNYSRAVSVGAVAGQGDAEFVSAIAEGAARGAISAMKKMEKEEP